MAFTIPDNKLKYIKENGIYDYLIDLEEDGKIANDDKEDIYQYFLANSMDYMTDENYSKFIDGLASMLKTKSSLGH